MRYHRLSKCVLIKDRDSLILHSQYHDCWWPGATGSQGISRYVIYLVLFNTLRPRQNGRHFADDISKCIFFNENAWISLKISLKFVPMARINNIPALVQIMAWRRPGDKPLSEPMMVNLLTHICVARPQWVKYQSQPHHRKVYWHDQAFDPSPDSSSYVISHLTHDVIITSLLRQNDAATSFSRNYDFIIMSCVSWDCLLYCRL